MHFVWSTTLTHFGVGEAPSLASETRSTSFVVDSVTGIARNLPRSAAVGAHFEAANIRPAFGTEVHGNDVEVVRRARRHLRDRLGRERFTVEL